jgi:Holliday junction DNA helicase RuvB
MARLQAQYEHDMEQHRTSTAQRRVVVRYGTEIFGDGDYPHRFNDFIGQADALEQLETAVISSILRGVPLDHVLLASGAQGIGKTTLAQIVAFELARGFVAVSGPMSVADARAILLQMQDGDVLFWDEFHLAVAGNRNRADWLLPLLTDHVLMTKNSVEVMPNITVIAATTDVGKLPATIVSRFMLRPTLTYYTDEEGFSLVLNLSQRMNVSVEPDNAVRIARAADNNPREMRMILTAVRDLTYSGRNSDDLDKAFDWAGVTYDGLTQVCQDILLVLLDSPDNTAGLETLQAALGEPGPLRPAEQRLIQKSLLVISGRGRKLTDAGIERAKLLAQEQELA